MPSAASLFCCRQLVKFNTAILLLFLRVVPALIYLLSSTQHTHHLFFCAWLSVVQVLSVVQQMRCSDIHPQRTHIWTHSCAGGLRNMYDRCGKLTWEIVIEYFLVLYHLFPAKSAIFHIGRRRRLICFLCIPVLAHGCPPHSQLAQHFSSTCKMKWPLQDQCLCFCVQMHLNSH